MWLIIGGVVLIVVLCAIGGLIGTDRDAGVNLNNGFSSSQQGQIETIERLEKVSKRGQ